MMMTGNSNSNLYVNNLPDGLDEEGFKALFEGQGTIMSVKYIPQHRYGFVKFATDEEAQSVINLTDGTYIGDNEIMVKLAKDKRSGSVSTYPPAAPAAPIPVSTYGPVQPYNSAPSNATVLADDQVYILDLPNELTTEGLGELFSGYGDVKWCKMMVSDGKPTAAAMVQFEDASSARWVVENLNGNIPQGLENPIKVQFKMKGKGKGNNSSSVYQAPVERSWPYSQEPQYASNPQQVSASFARGNDVSNLCVKGLPSTADKLFLYEVFAPHGGILSVKVISTVHGVLGFVKYATGSQAANAIKMVSGRQLPDGSVLDVAVKTVKS